ncbi:RnfH family protein [beta proteobacterium MWH-UniP1]
MDQGRTTVNIHVQVCAAWPDRTLRQDILVPLGSTPADIRDHADLLPELKSAWQRASGIGVFGLAKPLDEALIDGDRIELWRPLIADPKDARRQRAKLKLAELKKARLAKRQKAGSGSV